VPFRAPIVAIEPVLVENDTRRVGRVTLGALKRIECIVCCSEGVAERFVKMGFSPNRVAVVDRGVVSQPGRDGPGQAYLLAGGREHRDWVTLRDAAAGVELPVRLGAPNPPADHGALEVLPVLSHADYLEQLRSARALVIPLKDESRNAGLHALLEAFAHGVPVIASRNIATTDYIAEGAGVLVEAGDVDELREAMQRLSDPDVAAAASSAATELVRKRYSLTRFVQRVHELALRLC
jgi:glycosyltransferase involved in cell wall biosynthesis